MQIEGSSNIINIDYYPAKRELVVMFSSGDRYRYERVSATIYTHFMNAKSKGAYFSKEFKDKPGKYPCTKLGKAVGLSSSKLPNQSEIGKKQESLKKQEKPKNAESIEKLSRKFHKLRKNLA